MLNEDDIDRPVTEQMHHDVTRLAPEATVAETLEVLRRDPPGERIAYFYVVDDDDHLRGVVPTRRLLLSPAERHIDEIMLSRVLAIPSTATVRDACEFFALHRFLAIPVVDAERRLLGAVDVGLYTDELSELSDAENRNDLFQALGVYASTQKDESSTKSFLRRIPWLGSNLLGGLISAAIASLYRVELGRVVALALFIPVVLNLAESVGSQSVSLTLHALRGETPTWRFIARSLKREVATGAMLGTVCGAAVALSALVWLHQFRVSLSLLAGIVFGVVVSALLGLMLPIGLRLLNLDPKVAAGPIALATADIATLFSYLAFARWLLV